MKSIKEKAEEHAPYTREDSWSRTQKCIIAQTSFEAGANYVLDAIIECLPKTPAYNPNEVIDIIVSKVKQLKK